MTRMCRCGSRHARPVEVNHAGQTVALGHLCATCLYRAESEFIELQSQFQELLSLGVSRELANEVMIERINAMPARPEAAA